MTGAALPPTAIERERILSIIRRVLRSRATAATTDQEISEAAGEILSNLSRAGFEIREEEIPF